MKVLQDKLDNLAFNEKVPDHDLIIDSDNKENSPSQPHSFWQSTSTATNQFTTSSTKCQTPLSITKTTVLVGKNKKYPDIPLFYSDYGDNREKWEI